MHPLAGIRVIDLSQIYQGPYATYLMAMAGADVIKVEPTTGERLRGAGGAQTPLGFALLNGNKRSITLDLKQEAGKALLKRLVETGDVLVENFAPGVMQRLGLGHDVLRAINPRLVYASGTGYGLTGPDRDQLAMDHTIQAAAGIMSVTGNEGSPPQRAGGAPVDIMSGIHLYAGVVTALVHRATTGSGTFVEVAMQESVFFTLNSDFSAFHRLGRIPPRRADRTPGTTTPYSIYPCSDGHIALISVAEAHWQRVCEVMGRPELLTDPRFAKPAERVRHETELNAVISDWTRTQTRQAAFTALRAAQVPVAPVRDIDEVRQDPHMHARGMLEWHDHPDLGRVVLANSPLGFPELGRVPIRCSPAPGAHNDEVYGELLGLDADARASLRQRRVI